MIISIIAAMSLNRVIGIKNNLPWCLPSELSLFRKTTLGHHLVIGRKTFEAIGSKSLPNRSLIVITSSKDKPSDNKISFAKSLEESIKIAKDRGETELFIGGGTRIFEEALIIADKIYLSTINALIDGDAFFPEFNKNLWITLSSKHFAADSNNIYSWELNIFEKRRI